MTRPLFDQYQVAIDLRNAAEKVRAAAEELQNANWLTVVIDDLFASADHLARTATRVSEQFGPDAPTFPVSWVRNDPDLPPKLDLSIIKHPMNCPCPHCERGRDL